MRKTIFENSKYTIQLLKEIGQSRKGFVRLKYSDITNKIGDPNTTEIDSEDVSASWGIIDRKSKRKAFIWCSGLPTLCKDWSVDGDVDLVYEIFFTE
jgi:hypothetical protein